jgi:hypothetical protein
MFFRVDEAARRGAKSPHELSMVNLLLFNLLLLIALQRVAIAPILISLMVLIMLESGSIYQAGRGEVPNRLVERLPPPVDLARSESLFDEVDPEV